MTRRAAVRVRGLAPVARRDATILILGSMPGVASLAAGQYYAHPRNAFWPILGALLGFAAQASYTARVRALRSARLALWDVLASCERVGSGDAAIRAAVVNDFGRFFARQHQIRRVLFNGALAEASFRRHVIGHVPLPELELLRLPSTSPAHAALSPQRKLACWRAALA